MTRAVHEHIAVAIAVPAVLVAVAIAASPHLPAPLSVAEPVTFVGAAAVAILGVSLGARRALPARAVLAIDLAAVALLAVLALLPARSAWLTPLIDTTLIAFAWASGAAIGGRVEHPGHLLPAAAVASAADVMSVSSSWGPSAAIAASEQALSLLAISFPVIGTQIIAPALGVGDLVFVSLALGVARKHELPYRRIALLAFSGVLVAGLASALLDRAVPALPAIGAMIVAFVPATRTIRRKDRTAASLAVGVAMVVTVLAIVSALRRTS